MRPARALTWSDIIGGNEEVIRQDRETYLGDLDMMSGDDDRDERDWSQPVSELAERHYQMCASLIELLCDETARLDALFQIEDDHEAGERLLDRIRWLDACQRQARQDMRRGIYSHAGRQEEADADATPM